MRMPLFCTVVTACLLLPVLAGEKVYLDAGASTALKTAGADLARMLGKVTGREYQLLEADKYQPSQGDIILSCTPEKILSSYQPQSLPPQSWHFKNLDGNLVIAGTGVAGLVNGIYRFLDQYAGCWWPSPDMEVAPANPGWTVPDIDESGTPAYYFRKMYVGTDFLPGIFRMRNLENYRTGFDDYSPWIGKPKNSHTFDVYVKAVKAENRPELFGVNPRGQKSHSICLTNPEVQAIIERELRQYIQLDRQNKSQDRWPTIYDLSQSDGASGSECVCPGCRKLLEEQGSYSGPMLSFINALARKIKGDYPDIKLRTFAYSYTSNPPRDLVAEDNVIIQFCQAWLWEPLLPNGQRGSRNLEAWARCAKNLQIWSYWRDYLGFDYPFCKKSRDIYEEVRYCRQKGVQLYFCENERMLTRSFAMLQYHLLFRLLLNPEQPLEPLVQKFCQAFYGPAAEPLQNYLRHLEDRQEISRAYLDYDFFTTAEKFLTAAEELAAADQTILANIAWERIPVDSALLREWEKVIATAPAGAPMPRRQEIIERYQRNLAARISSWPGFQSKHREPRLAKLANEVELLQQLPAPLPPQFQGREIVDIHWNSFNGGVMQQTLSDDPEAVCKVSAGLDEAARKSQKLPLSFGIYNSLNQQGQSVTLTAAEIPQDEKFHWYHVGNAVVQPGLYMYYSSSWVARHYVTGIGIVPEEYEIHVSLKATGPLYVQGSQLPNDVRIDRIILAKPVAKDKQAE
ncbi:MAG: DUF4838 domain-containing protein [Oligosphaeraceae bacterium]|nr:DUF4838 domain-containing protein [Oligosphaeraceae bacterium]